MKAPDRRFVYDLQKRRRKSMISLSVSFASQGSPWQQKTAFVSTGGVYSEQLPIASGKI